MQYISTASKFEGYTKATKANTYQKNIRKAQKYTLLNVHVKAPHPIFEAL